ncbi:hypothetical protein PFISCL1PPCAC_14435, partial [Pristionchus fissidentatus]
ESLGDFMDKFKPTENEIIALFGLGLWSIENTNSSDHLLALAVRNRTEIVSSLMAGYKMTIGEAQGVIRIGRLFALISTIRSNESNQKNEYEVYRMLNLFEDNSAMCQIQK